MDEDFPSCPDCSTAYAESDNYCRKCGMYLAALRQMPLVQSRPAAPAKVRRDKAALPAPVKKAATALAVGTALQIGVGLAGKYMANQAARHATRAAVGSARTAAARRSGERSPAESRSGDPTDEAAAVSETVMIRRVWIRRS